MIPESMLCDGCRQALLTQAGEACMRCGAPVGPHVDPEAGCNFCAREKFAFDRVIRLGVYSGDLRAACLQSKGAGQEPVAAALAGLLGEQSQAELQATKCDFIVPVPHFWLQRLYRLHNPAETMADAWARILKTPKTSHILSKAKWTKPQRSLPATRRRENVRRAFKVGNSREIKGATVLLVDDIMTTGATAHEAARVLKRAGAGRVIAVVVAKAVGFR